MHVLWTPSWYPTPEAPFVGTFFAEQRRMLQDSGLTVGVLTLEAKSMWELSIHIATSEIGEQTLRRIVPTIPMGILPGDAALIEAMSRVMGREYADRWGVPDVIHAHSAFPGILVAQALAKMWKVPFGFTEHRPSSMTRNPRSFRYRAIRQAVHGAAFNVTVSTDMALKLGKYYGVSPFEAIALPAPDEFFSKPLHSFSHDSFTFMHVSHMDRNKRVEETIRAFAELKYDHPGVRLLLIGGEESRVQELRAYAASLNVDEAIECVGRVDRSQIASYMQRGDCMILVSEFEAGGTVFAEAQALSLPIIASATAAGKFMVTPDTGKLVPIDDHQALVAAMRAILDESRTGLVSPAKIRSFARARSSTEAFVATHRTMYQSAIAK